MKRFVVFIAITAFFAFSPFKNTSYAQVSCPSGEISCRQIDYEGGCASPCIKVVTRSGGPGGRGAGTEAQCVCKEPENQTGTVPLGGSCERASDCAPPGQYCWGEFNQEPVCHEKTAGETLNEKASGSTANEPKIEDLCKYAGDKFGECEESFKAGEAWTAIGRIPTTPEGFVSKFLSLGIGIAGGIAFLLILFSGFQMLTSVGNPEKLNAGKELLTSAISGLVLIVFSIFLLRLIGVDILGLPEFK